jgi:hypothetical protein
MKQQVIAKIKALMAYHGVTLDDIAGALNLEPSKDKKAKK